MFLIRLLLTFDLVALETALCTVDAYTFHHCSFYLYLCSETGLLLNVVTQDLRSKEIHDCPLPSESYENPPPPNCKAGWIIAISQKDNLNRGWIRR